MLLAGSHQFPAQNRDGLPGEFHPVACDGDLDYPAACGQLAPDELILANGENKVLLRRVLQRQGGDWKRPKLAFHVPMEKRYRSALERLCQDWLSAQEIRKHGILNESYVQENLRYLGRGDFLASKRLVTMASLHMWLDAHGTVH